MDGVGNGLDVTKFSGNWITRGTIYTMDYRFNIGGRVRIPFPIKD
jgi:hypothetical protein